MINKQIALDKLSNLVERFGEQINSYKSADYNETQTRRDFIDPFFSLLGWDVDNQNGYAEAYREVIHEDKIIIGGATKAPDYSFRLPGGKRLFFVEAKKPSVYVKDEILPAYQVRRYGWSAKLPISIITDFEEFAIYDCTVKPNPSDAASVARIKYLTFRDYIPEFDFLMETFSKERVLKGSFDKFIEGTKGKKGTATVDKEFLKSLDDLRTFLASSIIHNNKQLTSEEINFAVQQTIDRIIFLRIAEDRNIEPYGNLKDALISGDFYPNLFRIFTEADQKYNSGLFDFRKDKISRNLVIENKVIKKIINDLYYPESPYEFSVLPVEILGSVYEQFLGKTINITAAHHVKIEEKPEVRKAGGVYYTPQYIVDYIVKNTVGKITEGKSPKEIAKIKIVDPACGSGSFLIGAYQFLLDWYKEYYTNSPKAPKNKKDSPLTPDGNLTTAEKKRILLNNIYGVDIDVNAVEVTKLSLLLKCLEGETRASIEYQLSMFNERVLPSLDNNIKDGNSLIDTDYYDTQLDFGEDKKIKPFNWQKAFPEVFSAGGFDCVIGNPPYLRLQGLQETQPESLSYYKDNYEAAKSGNYDIYVLFNERGYNLLNNNGVLGFIQPHKFFQSDFGSGIRNFLVKNKALYEIVNFGHQQVFKEASTYSCLLFLQKNNRNQVKIKNVEDLNLFISNQTFSDEFLVDYPPMDSKWNFFSPVKESLMKKLNSLPYRLGDITRKIFVGLQTSADKIYVLEIEKEKRYTIKCFSKSLNESVEIEKGLLKPFLMGKDVKRYRRPAPRHVVIFPYLIDRDKPELMSRSYIKENFPLGWDYLLANKRELEDRERGRMKCEGFYSYIYPKSLTEFDAVKIMTPDIASGPQMTIDSEGLCYHTTTVYSIVFNEEIKEEQKYFLGILNSPLLWYFLQSTGNILRGGYFRFKTEYLKPFPIKLIDFENKQEKEHHDNIVKNVDKLLALHLKLEEAKLDTEINQIQTHISHCEQKINTLVYSLYNLTPPEIHLIEGGNMKQRYQ